MDEQLNQPTGQITPPPNYLVWAILTTIFCCLPFGIVSIIYAAQVNSKWVAGDSEGAKSSSKNARTWAWVSFFAAIAIGIFYAILLALGIGTAIFGGIFGDKL